MDARPEVDTTSTTRTRGTSLNIHCIKDADHPIKMDKLIGLGMLTVATVVFVYYTTWTFVLPFVDEPHFIFSFFPPREWAIKIPVILLLAAVTLVGTFIGSVMIKQAEKERRKVAAKKSQ